MLADWRKTGGDTVEWRLAQSQYLVRRQGKNIVFDLSGVRQVSSIGIGKEAFWASLLEGRSGIRRLAGFGAGGFPDIKKPQQQRNPHGIGG